MGMSLWHLLIVLLIVFLLFGTKRLSNLGSDLGNAIKGFKKAVGDEEKSAEEQAKVQQKSDTVIDVTPEKKKDQV